MNLIWTRLHQLGAASFDDGQAQELVPGEPCGVCNPPAQHEAKLDPRGEHPDRDKSRIHQSRFRPSGS